MENESLFNPENKIYIHHDGCNRRMLDIATMEEFFTRNGYQLVHNIQDADCIIVTTCAFKQKEEDNSVKNIREMKKSGKKLFIYGCLPDISPEKFSEFTDIDHLTPRNFDKLDTYFGHPNMEFNDIPSANKFPSMQGTLMSRVVRNFSSGDIFSIPAIERITSKSMNKVRNMMLGEKGDYFLFISRGCLGKCNYCAIKRAVGSIKSKTIDTVIREYIQGLDQGYNNFILLGDDPGCYGVDLDTDLPTLLDRLAEVTEQYEKEHPSFNKKIGIDINEIHPKWMIEYQEQIISSIKSDYISSILCPIQSGNDRILEVMQREHNSKDIRDAFLKVKQANPNVNISTQLMVGYPSETEEEFLDSLRFAASIDFEYIVVFPYHEKEKTGASELDGKIPLEEIDRRFKYSLRYLRQKGKKVFTSCP